MKLFLYCCLFQFLLHFSECGLNNSGDPNAYSHFYLSENGSDTSGCGSSTRAACKTLQYVLSIYYNTTHANSTGLWISTSVSLTLDQQLTDRFPLLENSSLLLSSWKDSDLYNLEVPCIKIIGMNFGQTIWEMINLSVYITDSNTNLMTLKISTFSSSETDRSAMQVNVRNSILGHCNFTGISVIKISNCSFTDRSYRKTLLTISDSNVAFDKLNMSKGIFVQAQFLVVERNSSVTLKDSEFFNNEINGSVGLIDKSILEVQACRFIENVASDSIIHSARSFLRIENSLFKNNTARHGAISLVDQTVMQMSNSLFINNMANRGSSLSGSDVHMSIDNSSFIGNSANNGGAIAIQTASELTITSSYFSENFGNNAGGAIYIASSTKSNNQAKLFCSESLFVNNIAPTGAAIQVDPYWTLQLFRVNFTENRASKIGAAMHLYGHMNVTVFESSFNGNVGSACYLSNNVHLRVTDSQFQNNLTPLGGGAIHAYGSQVVFKNVSFTENDANGNGGSAYLLSVNLTCFKCMFSKNSASYQGGGIWSENSKLVINHSAFSFNSVKTNAGGAIFAIYGHLILSNSSFYGQHAGDAGSIDISAKTDAHLKNCMFTGNLAVGDGGAIRASNSKLALTKTTFRNNSGRYGGALNLVNSELKSVTCHFQNNTATRGSGGIIYGERKAIISIKNSDFSNNSALLAGGAIGLTSGSKLSIQNSKFYNNSASRFGGAISSFKSAQKMFITSCLFENNTGVAGLKGGAISVDYSKVFLEKCTFRGNHADAGGAIYYAVWGTLRISETTFSDDTAKKTGHDISCSAPPKWKQRCKIDTYISLFTHQHETINSSDKDFKEKALKENWIRSVGGHTISIDETPYASVIPHRCLHNCSCRFSLKNNVFNCNNKNLTKLPDSIENSANWLSVEGNYLKNIIEERSYLVGLTGLDMKSSNIVRIDKGVIKGMTKTIKYLDISKNKLQYLPKEIQDIKNATKLWISNNPYTCNCDMIWMRDWLIDAGNVMDKENVKCHSGKWNGTPIYKLDAKKMGCGFPIWATITISLLACFFIIVVIVLNRKWEKIKFYMFVHFNVLTDDDGPEDLDEMEFDGFMTYSHLDRQFVKNELIQYLEHEAGLKLCIHERDFLGGAAIAANIVAAIEHSRRMIMVISNNYVQSGWCMEEFRIAHSQMTEKGRKNFLIPLLYEEVNVGDLDADLKMYIETHTYIDTTNLDLMKKRLRYAMPHVPLFKHKRLDDQSTAQRTTYGTNNVAVMAKRIANGNKRKRASNPPPEGACGGDKEISGSETEDSLDETTPLVQ